MTQLSTCDGLGIEALDIYLTLELGHWELYCMHNIRAKFIKTFDNHHHSVYRFMLVKVSNKQLAQDLTSETFTKAWDAIARDPSKYPRNEKAYLFQVANNCAIDHWRKNKEVSVGEENIIDYLDMSESESPDIHLDTQRNVSEVQAALSKLPPDTATLLTLKYVEELPNKEIAKILGKSHGAIRVAIHRALKDLKSALDSAE